MGFEKKDDSGLWTPTPRPAQAPAPNPRPSPKRTAKESSGRACTGREGYYDGSAWLSGGRDSSAPNGLPIELRSRGRAPLTRKGGRPIRKPGWGRSDLRK